MPVPGMKANVQYHKGRARGWLKPQMNKNNIFTAEVVENTKNILTNFRLLVSLRPLRLCGDPVFQLF